MSDTFPPDWPPAKYEYPGWPDNWLRFEQQYPGSGRASRLVAHADVPYETEMVAGKAVAETLGLIASDYLKQLEEYLKKIGDSLNLPAGWDSDVLATRTVNRTDLDLMHWLEVWPPVDKPAPDPPPRPPRIASWNLSREGNNALPATIIMVASELLDEDGNIAVLGFGLRVPMLVEATDCGIRVTIRSMTAEYHAPRDLGWTELAANGYIPSSVARSDLLGALVAEFRDSGNSIFNQIGASASVVQSSTNVEEFWFSPNPGAVLSQQPITIEMVAKARGSIARYPNPLSYRVVSRIEVTITQTLPGISLEMNLVGTETCPLVTNVGQGEAMVFVQTPPACVIQDNPVDEYDWTLRRPTRTDDILERFWELRLASAGNSKKLDDPGFEIRLCPDYVVEDRHQPGPPTNTKIIQLPADKQMPPRRNEFSALSAYFNSSDFFDMLRAYGIDPATFVVRAETDIQIFYRYGITPGPGRGGKTINAQVAFDCDKDGSSPPPIRMNLALANLSRWARPKHGNGKRTWAQPLGIAADRRWMMHEFGHYLLAARIGKLEFDFAHSPGDAMAAVYCDPESRLADRRMGMAESFRGITYPFVFSTRRHDRTPGLGWAWYGEMNRAVIQAPPSNCEQTKGYLTEQILSSTIFRLYRALGGDTMAGDEPDVYVRQRASFLTLFLLIQAINGLAQSPSKAEMLELGMEDAGLLLGGDLLMVPQPILANPPPQPDGWKGGVTHKVVRWAFETQGMFPQDPEAILNGVGTPPPVDIYIEDRRPLEEVTTGGRITYGPGSYCPVSLDWSATARWLAKDALTIGNRGTETAAEIRVRLWLGVIVDDSQAGWELSTQINWFSPVEFGLNGTLGPGQTQSLQGDEMDDAFADAAQSNNAQVLFLIEVTCPADRANTHPLASKAIKIDALADLPMTPRALTDLVANDNNLGLKILRFP